MRFDVTREFDQPGHLRRIEHRHRSTCCRYSAFFCPRHGPRRHHSFVGDRLLFDGAVGTQSTFPWGSPDDMRSKVRELRELFGGTLLLAPTHVLEPEVPLDNIFAFFEAADEPFE